MGIFTLNIIKKYLQQKLQSLVYRMSKPIKDTNKAIKRLTKHLEENGWTVIVGQDLDKESECDPNERVITINESKPINILWTMLHEAGHSLIFGLDDYCAAFSQIAKQHRWNNTRRTKRFHYQRLKEEMLAWETGLNLAKSLNIYVDEDRYDAYASKFFMTYVYEASQRFYQKHVQAICEASGVDIDFGLND